LLGDLCWRKRLGRIAAQETRQEGVRIEGSFAFDLKFDQIIYCITNEGGGAAETAMARQQPPKRKASCRARRSLFLLVRSSISCTIPQM
jgi:hypothetical protein